MNDRKGGMHAYPNIDGTLELMLGTALFLIGLLPVLLLLPIDAGVLLTLLPFVIMGLFLGSIWFKYRVTYPRTGYVQPRRMSMSSTLLLGLSVFVMLFKHLLPDNLYLLNEGYALLVGVFWTVIFLLMGQGLRRFYLYAAVALLMGIGTLAVGLEPELGASLTTLLTGTVLLVSGGRVLRRYLAHNPPPEQGA